MEISLGGSSPRKSRRIGLTPLADLVFILLVFFILETSFENFQQLDFRLPENKTEGEGVAEFVEMQLFASGQIWVNGNTFQVSELDDYFKSSHLGAETLITLKAEDSVPLQLLVQVMDEFDVAGMNKVLVQQLEQ